MPFLALIKPWWKHIIIALVIIGAILWVRNLMSTVESQKKTIAQNEVVIADLGGKIELQNAAVDQLKKDADAREQLGKQAVAAAEAKARINKQRADQLAAAVPQFPDDLCRSANALINEEIRK